MRKEPSYEQAYVQSYDQHNADRTLAGRFLQKSHMLLESTLPKEDSAGTILEVGAGSGHHFAYVEKNFSKYIMTDASQDMLSIASEKYQKEISTGLLEIDEQNATALSYPDHSVDRLIATHVLEHLPDPVSVLKEWNRVVRPGGIISIVLPCDPGLLWRFGRYLGPRRNAKKKGIAYDYLQAAEHINSIFNLVVFMRHHFEDLSESWYPAMVPVPDLNLFYVCHARTAKN